MNSDSKIVLAVVAFMLIVAVGSAYDNKQKENCRMKALERNLSVKDIKELCR